MEGPDSTELAGGAINGNVMPNPQSNFRMNIWNLVLLVGFVAQSPCQSWVIEVSDAECSQ